MNKLFIIGGILLLIAAGGIVMLLFFPDADPAVNAPTDVFAPADGSPSGGTGTGTVGGTLGTEGDSFLLDPAFAEDPNNQGYYYLEYHPFDGDADAPFHILYIEKTDYITIELLKEPLGEMRLDAEALLLAKTGRTQSELCSAPYMVSVPNAVSERYASRNLGYSFCPGAVPLP